MTINRERSVDASNDSTFSEQIIDGMTEMLISVSDGAMALTGKHTLGGRVMEKCGFIDTGMTFDYSFLYHGEGRPVVYMRLDKMIPMSSIQ